MGMPGMFHIGMKLLSLVKRTIWPVRQVYMNRNQSSAQARQRVRRQRTAEVGSTS
jgi:hypothetical protein